MYLAGFFLRTKYNKTKVETAKNRLYLRDLIQMLLLKIPCSRSIEVLLFSL